MEDWIIEGSYGKLPPPNVGNSSPQNEKSPRNKGALSKKNKDTRESDFQKIRRI